MLDFTIDRFVKNKNVLIEENDKVFKFIFKRRIYPLRLFQTVSKNVGKTQERKK